MLAIISPLQNAVKTRPAKVMTNEINMMLKRPVLPPNKDIEIYRPLTLDTSLKPLYRFKFLFRIDSPQTSLQVYSYF